MEPTYVLLLSLRSRKQISIPGRSHFTRIEDVDNQ